MTKIHYFDNAATTVMSEEAIERYASVARSYRGNPSALHQEGEEAKELLDSLRQTSAALLGVQASQLYFTSGGTESNAIILNSLLWRPQKAEIVLTNIEHPSIRQCDTFYRQLGWKIHYLDAPGGFVRAGALEKVLNEKTRLVCCLLVNNVVGSIQDVASLVKVVREQEQVTGRKIHVHCDAVQALGKIPFSLTELGVDSASFSAHKVHGPKGVGILYNTNPAVTALNRAGDQEQGLRGGTENLSGIASMVTAMEDAVANQGKNYLHVKKINVMLRKRLSFLKMLSPPELCSPYILTISVRPWPSELFTRLLFEKGFCVSTGSACSSNAKQKTRGVLLAMQVHPDDAKCSLRLSFSDETTMEEAEELALAIERTYRELS